MLFFCISFWFVNLISIFNKRDYQETVIILSYILVRYLFSKIKLIKWNNILTSFTCFIIFPDHFNSQLILDYFSNILITMNNKFKLFVFEIQTLLLCIRVYLSHKIFLTYELIILIICCSQYFTSHFSKITIKIQ